MRTRQKLRAIFWEILQWSMRKLFKFNYYLIIELFHELKTQITRPLLNWNLFWIQKLWSFGCVSIQSASFTATKCKNACGSTKIRCSSFAGTNWLKYEFIREMHFLTFRNFSECLTILAAEKRASWKRAYWTRATVESKIHSKLWNIDWYRLFITAS